jgi:hypothetical protein
MNPLAIIAFVFVVVALFNYKEKEKPKNASLSETDGNRGDNISRRKQGIDRERNHGTSLRKKPAVGRGVDGKFHKKEKPSVDKTHGDAGGSSGSDPVGMEPIRADERGEPLKEAAKE